MKFFLVLNLSLLLFGGGSKCLQGTKGGWLPTDNQLEQRKVDISIGNSYAPPGGGGGGSGAAGTDRFRPSQPLSQPSSSGITTGLLRQPTPTQQIESHFYGNELSLAPSLTTDREISRPNLIWQGLGSGQPQQQLQQRTQPISSQTRYPVTSSSGQTLTGSSNPSLGASNRYTTRPVGTSSGVVFQRPQGINLAGGDYQGNIVSPGQNFVPFTSLDQQQPFQTTSPLGALTQAQIYPPVNGVVPSTLQQTSGLFPQTMVPIEQISNSLIQTGQPTGPIMIQPVDSMVTMVQPVLTGLIPAQPLLSSTITGGLRQNIPARLVSSSVPAYQPVGSITGGQTGLISPSYPSRQTIQTVSSPFGRGLATYPSTTSQQQTVRTSNLGSFYPSTFQTTSPSRTIPLGSTKSTGSIRTIRPISSVSVIASNPTGSIGTGITGQFPAGPVQPAFLPQSVIPPVPSTYPSYGQSVPTQPVSTVPFGTYPASQPIGSRVAQSTFLTSPSRGGQSFTTKSSGSLIPAQYTTIGQTRPINGQLNRGGSGGSQPFYQSRYTSRAQPSVQPYRSSTNLYQGPTFQTTREQPVVARTQIFTPVNLDSISGSNRVGGVSQTSQTRQTSTWPSRIEQQPIGQTSARYGSQPSVQNTLGSTSLIQTRPEISYQQQPSLIQTRPSGSLVSGSGPSSPSASVRPIGSSNVRVVPTSQTGVRGQVEYVDEPSSLTGGPTRQRFPPLSSNQFVQTGAGGRVGVDRSEDDGWDTQEKIEQNYLKDEIRK